jgi:hypothetical protein
MLRRNTPRRSQALAAALVLAALPLAARAQVYKCPQANGSTGYQSTPCATGAKPDGHPTAAELNAARAAQAPPEPQSFFDPYKNPVGARPKAAEPMKPSVASPTDGMRRIDNDDERRRACTIALNNDAVLSRQTPAFSYDRNGNRVDVLDMDRQRLLAEAKAQEARYCK